MATGRTTPSIAHPDSETIRQIAAVLATAERPALLAGIGVRSAGVADLVERLAYRLHIPVLTDVEGKGALRESDPLCLGLTGVGQSPFVTRYLQAMGPCAASAHVGSLAPHRGTQPSQPFNAGTFPGRDYRSSRQFEGGPPLKRSRHGAGACCPQETKKERGRT